MTVLTERNKVRFISGDTECAAWHYPGTNGACVIMAGGFAVTKEPATDLFARRFHEAGFSVLAFDYRRLGESGGQPRLVLPIREQLADWQAAIAFAATLPGRRPGQGSRSGASPPRAAMSSRSRRATRSSPRRSRRRRTPTGRPALRNAASHQKPLAMLRFTGRGILDALGGLIGRRPLLVPLAGRGGPSRCSRHRTPSTTATGRSARTTGTRTGSRRSPPARRCASASTRPAAGVPNAVPAAGPRVRPGHRLRCAEPAIGAANRAPRGELVRMPGGHYEPFLGGHEQAVKAELSFLRRHLLELTATARLQRPPALRALRLPGHEAAGVVLRDDRVRGHRW